MDILLVNTPHPSIGSRIPHEHLPPLGLLAVGGPLIDGGHTVRLVDAEFGPLSTGEIVDRAVASAPQAVLLGHAGSTSAHPIIAEITRAIRKALPDVWIVYGGVFPTYHWREILAQEPQIDVIVRGEGEETAAHLIHALEADLPLESVDGIAYRREGQPSATRSAPLILNLDALRVGWELVDLHRYSYWGDRQAVVVQFSRGLSSFMHILWPTPLLGALAASRPAEIRRRAGLALPDAWSRSHQLRRREPHRLRAGLARLSRSSHR